MAKIPGIQKIEGTNGTYYRAQVRLRGHRHLSKNFSKIKEAEKWRIKTIDAMRSGRPYETTEMRQHTLGDIIDRYIETELDSESTNYKTRLGQLQWWKQEIGHCILTQITEDLICQCRDKLLKTTDQFGRSRSKSTFNRYRTTLSVLLNVASREWRLIPSSPVQNVRKLKENRPRCRILDKEERQRLLKACYESKSRFLYPIVLLAITSGMRKGEILGVRWKDIDWDKQLIHLESTKNGDRRIVPVTKAVIEQLRALQSSSDSTESYVFSLPPHHQPINIRSSWDTALAEAKIEGFRFHDTRHCAVSTYTELGYSLHVISKIVGHRSISMTNQYSHLLTDQIIDATEITTLLDKDPEFQATLLTRLNRAFGCESFNDLPKDQLANVKKVISEHIEEAS